ncbi:MAG: polysaccharide deacetylase family protein [Muribaculaceae bacterium]|nr:polysaccharide deacetylase family protein [Muribaculaceae bacterium]
MILLSFDTEEFDVPRESGVDYTLAEGVEVSRYGTAKILDILDRTGVKATFFCTTNFAENAPDIMQRTMASGHEIAAHGCDHWQPKPSDVFEAKKRLEELTGCNVLGYRQPRMFAVSDEDIRSAGYLYNSSLNPCFIPGHYNHLDKPRTAFMQDGVLQIPASVTPLLRIPLFWLAVHNFPPALYRWMARRTVSHDGYLSVYMHPWEFYPLGEHPEFKMKFISRNHAGMGMERRLEQLIRMFLDRGEEFTTYGDFARRKIAQLTGDHAR